MVSGWVIGERAIRTLIALLFAIYNLIPLYGLWAWGWDAFQLLILYWSETVVLAAWAMVRIAFVPTDRLGSITINGNQVKTTHRLLIGVLSLTTVIFCAAHLLLLFVMFSRHELRQLHSIKDFLWTLYIVSDAWIALAMVTIAGGFDVLAGEYHPQFVDEIARRLRIVARPARPIGDDPVGSVVANLFGRIAVMQIAIICGAWFASRWGALGPFSIIVAIKALIDFKHRSPSSNR
jgi:hypothetical protein